MQRGRGAAVGGVVGLVLMAMIAAAAFWPPGVEGQRGARVGQVAPEITGGPWIHSEPLSLAGLRGRVIFVEFWTYG
jgi:hypothetical protein